MREKHRGKAREERGYRDSQGKAGKVRRKKGEGVLRTPVDAGATQTPGLFHKQGEASLGFAQRGGVPKQPKEATVAKQASKGQRQKKTEGTLSEEVRQNGERQSVRQKGRQRNKGRRAGEKWKRSRKLSEVGARSRARKGLDLQGKKAKKAMYVRRSLNVTLKRYAERARSGASLMSSSSAMSRSPTGQKAGVDRMRRKTEEALERRKPIRETKGRKKGGTIRQIPVGVNTKRGQYRVGKWFRNGVRSGRQSTSEGSGKALRVERAALVGRRSPTPKGGAEVVGTQRKGSNRKQRKSPKNRRNQKSKPSDRRDQPKQMAK